MSDDLNSSSGTNTEGSADGAEGKPSSALEANNRKLLAEKKKLQAEYEDMKAKLDQIENEKLESSGQLKQFADGLKKQLEEEKKRSREVHKLYSDKMLRASFEKKAAAMGVVDVELAFLKFKNDGLADAVEIKDDFSFEEGGLEAQISELQKKSPVLFKKEAVAPKDGTPTNQITKKPISEMSKEELRKSLKAVW